MVLICVLFWFVIIICRCLIGGLFDVCEVVVVVVGGLYCVVWWCSWVDVVIYCGEFFIDCKCVCCECDLGCE